MARFPVRFGIGSIMIGVAILALFFAGYGVKLGALEAAFFLLILTPVVFVRADRKLPVAGCLMALYPILISVSLYATYIAGWVSLGRPPRPSLDDPKFIGPLVDWFYDFHIFICNGLPASLLACLVLTCALTWPRPSADGSPRRWVYWPLNLLLVWFLGIFWFAIDLFRVMEWFMD